MCGLNPSCGASNKLQLWKQPLLSFASFGSSYFPDYLMFTLIPVFSNLMRDCLEVLNQLFVWSVLLPFNNKTNEVFFFVFVVLQEF